MKKPKLQRQADLIVTFAQIAETAFALRECLDGEQRANAIEAHYLLSRISGKLAARLIGRVGDSTAQSALRSALTRLRKHGRCVPTRQDVSKYPQSTGFETSWRDILLETI